MHEEVELLGGGGGGGGSGVSLRVCAVSSCEYTCGIPVCLYSTCVYLHVLVLIVLMFVSCAAPVLAKEAGARLEAIAEDSELTAKV